jgi:hypothetical protein
MVGTVGHLVACKYSGFSFHFDSSADAAAVVEAVQSSSRLTSVDSSSLKVFKYGFYISWFKPLRVLGARSWLVRLVPHLAQHRQFPSICCHSVPYRDDIDFGTMVRCSKQESGTRLVVYKIQVPNLLAPVVVAPAVNSASNVAPLVSYSTSPTSCWALALLESQEMLKDRSDHYKIGDAIGKGTFSQRRV